MRTVRRDPVRIGSKAPLQAHSRKNSRAALSPLVLLFFDAGLFLVCSVGLASGQTPSRKIYHPPRTLLLTKFYDTPIPLPAGKPGELIRFEQFDEYQLSYEVSTYRILYHSRSARGEDVAVSGVVLLPDGAAPTGGWPIIAWAHDFTGSARECAPSLLKNLNQGPLLSMYANLGYAVVASDYAGLGTNSPHADLDARSHAMDVIYSVAAARAALQQLGNKWVSAGYGQGALVAVAVGETAGETGDANYAGAIAISGVAEPGEFFEHLAAQGADYSPFVFLAHGIKTVFPGFRVEDMLTAKGLQLYQEIGRGCEVKIGHEPAANELVKPGWESNSHVESFFSRNALGTQPANGPLLIIHGEADPGVPTALANKAVGRLCEQKDRVLFVKYPGLAGSAALSNSVSEQTSWIRARFAGLPAPGNCP